MKKIKNLYLSLLISSIFCNSNIIFGMEVSEMQINLNIENEIVEIVNKNDFLKIKEILDDNSKNINLKNEYISKCLIQASIVGNIKIVELLLNNGIDINKDNNYTALSCAIICEQINIIKLLIKYKVDLNKISKLNLTPLMITCTNNKKEITKLLIENGANVNSKNREGSASLSIAAANNNKEIVELLIKNGANIDDQNDHGETPLMVASHFGCPDSVKLLLDNKANINCKDIYNQTALTFAINNGHKEVVELLLKYNKENGNSKDLYSQKVLEFALGREKKEIAQLLINYGANINEKDIDGYTVLSKFIGSKLNIEIGELLIKNGADINSKNNTRVTPVIKASYEGRKDILKLLIDYDANINHQDNFNQSALGFALYMGHKEIIELLLKHNINKNNYDLSGMQNLFSLDSFKDYKNKPSENKFKRFKRLLNLVGNINKIHPTIKRTILMACLDFNSTNFDNQKFVNIVLNHDPNINFKNNLNESVYSIAKKNNRQELIFNYIDKLINEIKDIFKNQNNLNLKDNILKFKQLLFKIGSIKITDKNGDNLMHYAIKSGNFEFVKIIYALCPELISQVNKFGETPLSFIYNKSHFTDKMLQFIKLNLNPKNVSDKIFNYILSKIKRKDYNELNSHFANNPNNINIKNTAGYTPLHFVVSYDDLKMVSLLLKFNANKNAESIFGEKPIDIAIKQTNQEIINLLC